MNPFPKHIVAASADETRSQRREEQNPRPRGKGRATTLSAICATGKTHYRCCSLTCLCPCHKVEERG